MSRFRTRRRWRTSAAALAVIAALLALTGLTGVVSPAPAQAIVVPVEGPAPELHVAGPQAGEAATVRHFWVTLPPDWLARVRGIGFYALTSNINDTVYLGGLTDPRQILTLDLAGQTPPAAPTVWFRARARLAKGSLSPCSNVIAAWINGQLQPAPESALPPAPTPSPSPEPTPKPSPNPKPAVNCPKLKIFGVRGSRGNSTTDTANSDNVLNAFAARVSSQITGTSFEVIPYAAIPVGYGALDYGLKYVDSRSDGINKLDTRLEEFTTQCPNTPYVLVGYSQGADVVGSAFLDFFSRAHPAAAKRLLALVMFGDPRFNPKQPKVDDGNYNDKRYGIWGWLPEGTAGLRAVPNGYVTQTRSYCLDGDPVCGFTLKGAKNCANSVSCIHLKYRERGWVRLAANWTIQRWRKQSR